MFGSIGELNLFYNLEYCTIYSAKDTTPKYQFNLNCKTLYKRYKKDYKELLKFERTYKRALNKYWLAKKNNDKEKIKKFKKKLDFLNKKREKVVYNFPVEEKQNDEQENNEEPKKEEIAKE